MSDKNNDLRKIILDRNIPENNISVEKISKPKPKVDTSSIKE